MEIILLTVKYSQGTKVPAVAWNHCLIWQGLFYPFPYSSLHTPGKNDWVIKLISEFTKNWKQIYVNVTRSGLSFAFVIYLLG